MSRHIPTHPANHPSFHLSIHPLVLYILSLSKSRGQFKAGNRQAGRERSKGENQMASALMEPKGDDG